MLTARERIVGWYHTGPKLHHNDVKVNELIRRYCSNSVSKYLSFLVDVFCYIWWSLSRMSRRKATGGRSSVMHFKSSVCKQSTNQRRKSQLVLHEDLNGLHTVLHWVFLCNDRDLHWNSCVPWTRAHCHLFSICRFIELFKKYNGFDEHKLKLKRPTQLQEVLNIARDLLADIKEGKPVFESRNKIHQLKSVLEM